MKKLVLVILTLGVALSSFADPVSLTEAGVTAVTNNIILNKDPIPNGGSVESLGIAIAANGNVIVGWEDDDGEIAGGWIMVDKAGNPVTKELRSYADDSGKAIPVAGGWGPKIHANMYGDGVTFGTSYWGWDGSDPSSEYLIEGYKEYGADDYPAVQIINNDGSFNGKLLAPYTAEFVSTEGAIRIGDAELLSNGNVVIIGEDRQVGDGPDVFELPNAGRVVIASIVKPDRTIVKGPVAVQQTDAQGEMWHGVATFNGGFGVRYAASGVKLRFFDNDLNPLTDEIDVNAIDPNLNAGGRGDGAGWHGNGKGKFLIVGQLNADVYAAVFDNTGKLVVNTFKADEGEEGLGIGADRVDGAIDENGNIFLAWRDRRPFEFAEAMGVIAGRFFNADGTPKTPAFVITSAATSSWLFQDNHPRVAFRNGIAAVTWQDKNTNALGMDEVALRIFQSPFPTSVKDWEIME